MLLKPQLHLLRKEYSELVLSSNNILDESLFYDSILDEFERFL